MSTTSKYVVFGVTGVGLIAIAVAVVVFLYPGPFRERETINVPIKFVADFSDDRRIVGWSDNVFVGTVLEQERTFSRSRGDVWTSFTVQVEQNLKGSLAGQIHVVQEGGLQKRWNHLVLMNGDPLLIPGQTYLLASRHNEEENWHTVAATYGTIQLEPPERRLEVVERFKDAVEIEIPFDVSKVRRDGEEQVANR